MKHLLLQISLYFLAVSATAQKPVITDSSYKAWTAVNQGKISNNGAFATYVIQNKPVSEETTVITATDNSWRKTLAGHSNARFTHNSKYCFTQKGDTLHQFLLNSDIVFNMQKCGSYDLIEAAGAEWLAYLENGTSSRLIVKNLETNKTRAYNHVYQFISNASNTALILLVKSVTGKLDTIKRLDLKTAKAKNIYIGAAPKSIIFDDLHQNIAFVTNQENGITSIWHFSESTNRCEQVASDTSKGMLSSHRIDVSSQWTFSRDGKYLFFTQSPKAVQPEVNSKGPEVWSYRDAYLFTRYRRDQKDVWSGRNLAVINLKTRAIRALLSGFQKPASKPGATRDYFLVKASFGDTGEAFWNASARISFYVCNFKTGKIFSLIDSVPYSMELSISPNGKYVAYFSRKTRQFSLYNVLTSKTTEFSLPEELQHIKPFNPSVIGWSDRPNKFYIQDRYALWQFDAENLKAGKVLTGSGEQRSKIIYSIATYFKDQILPYNQDIVVFGLNEETKEASLSMLNLARQSFKTLYKANKFVGATYSILAEDMFNKAASANAYLIKFETAHCSPNYTFTTDFKTFISLSNEQPENQFNWLSSEIISYADSGGRKYTGIIYKPENFDPVRKYPVLFQYYQYVSDEVHQYTSPEPTPAGLNIPLFVSSGYIVVKPDVPLIMGEPGNRALWSVEGAAKFMSKQTYVDSTKMGIIGHSLGGFETYYLITHSEKFVAAVSEAGTSNMVQQANEIWPGLGSSYHSYNKSIGFNGKLDSQSGVFLKNSPILFSKRITSPLLIVHNPEDKAVPVSQGLQMFVQLRSLHKPVWMLQYPGEGHNLGRLENKLDHQKKLLDFFNHYLKKKDIPGWMVKSIEADVNSYYH